MEHEELVEKVALAICRDRICGIVIDGVTLLCDALPDPDDKEPCTCRVSARSILSLVADALGEPTPAMYDAMTKKENWCAIYNYGAPPTADECWDVMLRASPLHPQGDKE